MIRRVRDCHPERVGRISWEQMVMLGGIVILGCVLVVPQLLGRRVTTNNQWAYTQTKSFEMDLELYALDHKNTYPQENEGLEALRIPIEGDPHWKGPYLKNWNSVPTGKDGRDETDDDIGNWMPPPT